MKPIKLHVVDVVIVDFRHNEASNLDEFVKTNLKPHKGEMSRNDAVIFFSQTGMQALFVKRKEVVELRTGQPRGLYSSMRLRLDGGSWWQNLVEFFLACERFGIDATGLRTKIYAFAEANEIHVQRKLQAVG